MIGENRAFDPCSPIGPIIAPGPGPSNVHQLLRLITRSTAISTTTRPGGSGGADQ